MFGRKENGVNKDAVMAALSTVQEPELHRDLVSLNMIHDLQVNDGAVVFTVMLTTPACPLKHVMEKDCRNAVMKVAGVKSVTVKWDANVQRDNRISGRLDISVKNTIAVASGKGGVGKSTVAVNIAVALAKTGASVGLMDADIYGPNCNIMLGVSAKPRISENNKMVPLEAHGVKMISMGLLVPPEQALVWRGPMLHSAIRQFISDVDWGDLDYLVVDLPPGTGDAQLSLAQSLPITGGVIVTLPQMVSQADARRGMAMFHQLKVPIIGVVENMGAMVLPDGTRVDVFGEGGGKSFAEIENVPFLGSVPLDPEVRMGGDSGQPIVVSRPESPAGQALSEIAGAVAARVSVLNFNAQPNIIPITMIG